MEKEQRTVAANQPVPAMPEQVSIEKVTNYEVYDAQDTHIGSTSAIWMDRDNQPAFIGVKTTWLLGKTHAIPAWGAEVNHQAKRVRLRCDGEIVKNAPSFSPDEELDEGKERQIMDYYQSQGGCSSWFEGATPRGESDESAEGKTIPLHEEELKVGKRSVETGGVRLRKIIRSETVQQPVELKREDIVVERVPAGAGAPSEAAFEEQDIYIPLRREEPVVQKEARVREQVRARKTSQAEQQNVSGEVRKEDVEVERNQQRKKAA